MEKIRIVVVDDQTMNRQYFSYLLEQNEKYCVVAELKKAEDAVSYCKNNPVDLVLMDVVMREGMNGLDAAEEVKRISDKIKIIVVTSMPEVSFVKRAKSIGVESFWYKEVQEQPMLEVIEKTLAGESVYPHQSPALSIGEAKSTDFTEAELQVLRELTTGATDREIAEKMFLSVATIRTHIRHMLEKSGCKNRVELAIKARVLGLVIGE
ncbi:MAG: response regulator transcription factor [Lachnospiraceae bacterium]|nr:response regulator transcription factor [Lachnospiraceae bacterium]